jgi:hypothetical protein
VIALPSVQPLGPVAGGRRVLVPHPINAGLAGWWPLDEGGGARARDIGPGNRQLAHMSTLNRKSHGVWRHGRFFQPASYPQYNTDTIKFPSGCAIGLSTWIVPTASQSSIFGMYITGRAGVHVNEGGFIKWDVNFMGGGRLQVSVTPYLGVWTHLLFTRRGTTAKIYANGVLVASSTSLAAHTGGYGLSIGYWKEIDYGSTARQANTRLWLREPTEAEARRLYEEPWIGSEIEAAPLFATGKAGATVHDLASEPLETGAPVLPSPTLVQVHVLSSAPLETGAPTLPSPAVAQVHALGSAALTTGAPALPSPAVVQVHHLASAPLETGAPVLPSPTVTVDGELDPANPPARRIVMLPARTRTARLAARDRVVTLPARNRTVLLSPERN